MTVPLGPAQPPGVHLDQHGALSYYLLNILIISPRQAFPGEQEECCGENTDWAPLFGRVQPPPGHRES